MVELQHKSRIGVDTTTSLTSHSSILYLLVINSDSGISIVRTHPLRSEGAIKSLISATKALKELNIENSPFLTLFKSMDSIS